MKTIQVSEKIEKMHRFEKVVFFNMYRKETWKKCGIEVIIDIYINSIYFWLNEKHIETGMGHSNLPIVTNKYGPKYKKY